MDNTRVFLGDCLPAMQEFPDKHFDLAIVDPPYGIGEDGKSNHGRGSKKAASRKYVSKEWDKSSETSEYFAELIRVSVNQIVWGANHFISKIPYDSSCWIYWDKIRTGDFADGELAWTSFKTALRAYTYRWNGFKQGPTCQVVEHRIHPTQKPVALYKWLLKNYAKEGDKILDTHLGSQSSRIAAFDMGFDFTGYELDADYFEAGCKRFENHKSQLKLFV